jgi:hypothetical protein
LKTLLLRFVRERRAVGHEDCRSGPCRSGLGDGRPRSIIFNVDGVEGRRDGAHRIALVASGDTRQKEDETSRTETFGEIPLHARNVVEQARRIKTNLP